MNFTPGVTSGARPVGPNYWISLIKRIPASRSFKIVALMLATYADHATGRDARPGQATLAADCSVSIATVRREMAELKRLGLIYLIRRGSRKLGHADEYGLSDPGEPTVPSEEMHRAVIQAIAENRNSPTSTAQE